MLYLRDHPLEPSINYTRLFLKRKWCKENKMDFTKLFMNITDFLIHFYENLDGVLQFLRDIILH